MATRVFEQPVEIFYSCRRHRCDLKPETVLYYCSRRESGPCEDMAPSNTRKWADSPMR